MKLEEARGNNIYLYWKLLKCRTKIWAPAARSVMAVRVLLVDFSWGPHKEWRDVSSVEKMQRSEDFAGDFGKKTLDCQNMMKMIENRRKYMVHEEHDKICTLCG